MERSSVLLVVATAFAGLGVAWAFRASGCQLRTPTQPPAALADTAALTHFAEITEFLDPANDAERVALVSEISDTLRSSFQQRNPPLAQRDLALLHVVEARVALMLSPDYDRYLAQITELTGRDGAEAVKGTLFEDRAMWEAFARGVANAAVAPEGVLVRTGSESLNDPQSLAGGARATLGDPGYYGSDALLAANAEVRDVVIPMILYPPDRPNGLTVYVTIGFVWNEARGAWVPYKTAVQDPTGESTLTATWI